MKKIVFAFGRFQPPTTGHKLLVDKTILIANEHNSDYAIYVSKTQDHKSNPLSVEQKMKYLSLMFPDTNFVACNNELRTFVETAKYLNNHYDELIMVAGSDRVAVFDKILQNCNGKDFNYRSIKVVSAGVRNPDANDASGMSGTKMREAAINGNFEAFYKGLPVAISNDATLALMKEIQAGLTKPARKRLRCY